MVETDLFGEPVVNGHKSVLAQTFSYPPFSVLNAREGWWQERKRQWLALGIKSEVGRGGDLIPNGGGNSPATDTMRVGQAPADRLGPQWTTETGSAATGPDGLSCKGGVADMGQLAGDHAEGPKLLPRQAAAAFDTRHGLATWQRDKRK